MVVLLGVGTAFLTTFLYSALKVAKRADEYVYKKEDEQSSFFIENKGKVFTKLIKNVIIYSNFRGYVMN